MSSFYVFLFYLFSSFNMSYNLQNVNHCKMFVLYMCGIVFQPRSKHVLIQGSISAISFKFVLPMRWWDNARIYMYIKHIFKKLLTDIIPCIIPSTNQNNSASEWIALYNIWFIPFRIRAQIIQCVVPPTLNMRGKPPCTDSAEFNFAENQVVRRLTALQNACGAGNIYSDTRKISQLVLIAKS